MPRRGKEKRTWVGGQRRKSPRLSQIIHDHGHGDYDKQKQSNNNSDDDNDNDIPKHSVSLPLHSYEQGDGAPNRHDDHFNDNDSWLPEKNILELVLDTLQRRDTYDIFAEPVDPSEVEEYYEIIKEPMDFGTMRAKLHEGMYKNLQQFKHDVFLIFGNALHFNSSTTVYFRQARALEDLAKKVFFVLKTDPENFILEFTTRRKSGKRFDSELSGLTFGSCRKLARDFGPSSMRTDHAQKGGRKQSRTSVNDQRSTYQPWMCLHDKASSTISPIYDETKSLIYANQVDVGYEERLMLFVKDLGVTAHRVATSKLQGLRMKASTNPNKNSGDSSTVQNAAVDWCSWRKELDASAEGNFSPSNTKTTKVATSSSGGRDEKIRIASNSTKPPPVKELQADNLDLNQIRAISISCSKDEILKAQVTLSSGVLGAYEFSQGNNNGARDELMFTTTTTTTTTNNNNNMVPPSSVSSQFMYGLPFPKPWVRGV